MEDNHNLISDEQLAAFLDGNVNADESAQILSALDSDGEMAEILALSSVIDNEVCAAQSLILPMSALAAANPENLCSFDCEIFVLRQLGFDVDHWSLLELAKANNWVRDEGTPLHHVGRLMELKGLYVERKYDATVVEMRADISAGKHVIAILNRRALDGVDDGARPLYHAVCVTGVSDDGVRYLNLESQREELVTAADFISAWQCSGNYMVAAAETPCGYNPQPINVEDIDLDADLEDLTEAIAENAHDIWARARMDEGWSYGAVRDDALKTHPDLVPYAQLPDSEKHYDRIMAMNTLRLVRRLGFDITNRNEF